MILTVLEMYTVATMQYTRFSFLFNFATVRFDFINLFVVSKNVHCVLNFVINILVQFRYEHGKGTVPYD